MFKPTFGTSSVKFSSIHSSFGPSLHDTGAMHLVGMIKFSREQQEGSARVASSLAKAEPKRSMTIIWLARNRIHSAAHPSNLL